MQLTVTQLIAVAGVIAISFSAVFIRLAAVSPVTAAFFRAFYALPALVIVRAAVGPGVRGRRERVLAVLSGAALACDLGFWHESIALIGAGLATVIANVQVVFVALAAWAIFGEKPERAAWFVIATALAGITLTSGLSGRGAYGANPALGAALGLAAGVCYSGFLLLFRASARGDVPTAAPLLDATIGMAAGALLISPLDPRFSFAPSWPAHGWLAALALVSQVAGWLAIATALPRLPAVQTSILLVLQPVFTLVWGQLLFSEHLSTVQWVGAAFVLGGVAAMPSRRVSTQVRRT
jgi:drug/metabolite transporter (DMT)-like permease